MTAQKYTLLVLSPLDLLAGPVRLQGAIDFLLDYDIELRKDRTVLVYFVKGI